jgi:TonB family protein
VVFAGFPHRLLSGFASLLPMKTTSCTKVRNAVLVVCALLALFGAASAQDSDLAEHGRKVAHRVIPNYPELAKQMKITGTVRLVAVVAPNGTVKMTQAVGGSPVLLKAAEDAVMKWKYASAPEESKELIELHFSPEE